MQDDLQSNPAAGMQSNAAADAAAEGGDTPSGSPDPPEAPQPEETQAQRDRLEMIEMLRHGPKIVVADEGHRMKNENAYVSQCMELIKTSRRIVLTGYPLQNFLKE